jgi:translation initiation factor 3 subunit B
MVAAQISNGATHDAASIDVSQIDFSDLDAEFNVLEEASYDAVLIIDNLPKVDDAKREKLLVVLKRILGQHGGTVRESEGLFMPMESDNSLTKGCVPPRSRPT